MYPAEIIFATMLLFMMIAGGYGILAYVMTGIFLSKLLKKAGHKTPYAAWVPIWNQATILQVAGIRGAWGWTAALIGGALLGALLAPFFIGSIIGLAVSVFAIIVAVYAFKAVQKATGVGEVGYIVLGIFFPWIWLILQSSAAERNGYDHAAAFRDSDSFPMNWFGEGDRYGVFLPGVLQMAPSPATSGYAAPAYAPEPMYPAPSAPVAPTEFNSASPVPPVAPAAPAPDFTSPSTGLGKENPVADSLEDLLAEKPVDSNETISSDVDKSKGDDEVR